MSLMRELVDRVYRDYLHAGDDQPARVRLAEAVDVDDPTVMLDMGLLPIDAQQVIAPGVVVEFGLERVLIADVADDFTVTMVRGVDSTEPAAHDAGALGVVSPAYSRQSVFDAVADNIVDLYPTVWGDGAADVSVVQGVTEVPADVGHITMFRGSYSGGYFTADARLITAFAAASTGVGAVIDAPSGTAGVILYRSRFLRPYDEDIDLETLGVRPEWERIVVVGAAAQLLSGRDAESITQEFVDEQLQAESLPPTTPGRVAARLTAYHEHLLERAGRRLTAEQGKAIRRRPVSRMAVR